MSPIQSQFPSGFFNSPSLALPSLGLLAFWYGGSGFQPEPSIGVADGDPVDSWSDKTGTYSPSNTGSARPIYTQRVSGVGRGAVDFTAPDQYLVESVAGGLLSNRNIYNLHIVFQSTASALGAMYAEGRSTSTVPAVAGWLNQGVSGNAAGFHRGDNSAGVDLRGGTAVNDGNVHILTVRRTDQTSFTLLVDGSEVAVGGNNVSVATTDRLSIGALVRTTVSAQFGGKIFSIAAYGIDNYAQVLQSLSKHYGVETPSFYGEFVYQSSIDDLDGLKASVIYEDDPTDKPILVVMHGFSEGAAAITATTRLRLAAYGVVVLTVSMRGRDGSTGSADYGAREIQDIVDAVEYLKERIPEVDQEQVYVLGYSGGGGNAFSSISKFPDYFNGAISYFGISDYGAWYPVSGSSRQALMDAGIGDNPTNAPDSYLARKSVDAVTNYLGHLWMFHDESDLIVPVSNSDNVRDTLDLASMTNYEYHRSDSGDATRWNHGYPDSQSSLIAGEIEFMPEIAAKSLPVQIVPESGTLQIAGYLVTKRFALWLGTGTEEFGEVIYNMTTRTFTITTETGAATWELTLKGQTPSSSISATINGVGDTQSSNADGIVVFTGNIS